MRVHNVFLRCLPLVLSCFLILCDSAFVRAEGVLSKDLHEALRFLIEDSEVKFRDVNAVFDYLGEFLGMKPFPGKAYSTMSLKFDPLKYLAPVVVDDLPDLSDEAIYDFRQTLKKDFIEIAGSPDGTMSRDQFSRFSASGRFLTDVDTASYFAVHDRDRDGMLSISEFVPSPSEVSRSLRMETLTTAYTEGSPYPTGQMPAAFPPAQSLFITKAQIEERIRRFASDNGFTAQIGSDGKLHAFDGQGNIVPLPPGLIPPPMPEAMHGLRLFARNIGGIVDRDPVGRPIVRDSSGKVVPIHNWPAILRPPYFPPNPPGGF